MKNGNLYQELKSVKKEERVAWAKEIEMKLAMEQELEEAIRTIKEKYDSIIEILEKESSDKWKKVLKLAFVYNDYSRVHTYYIVNTVAAFLTYIEGEKYIPFSSSQVNQNSIIIKEEVSKQYEDIDYETLDRLYKNGDLIMLDDGYSNMVNFYDNIGEANYSFGKFNYMHEFVNRLIQYRIDNGIKSNIDMEQLYSFMCEFISKHPTLALKNKDKREQMLMEKCEDETLISQCKKIELKLNK